MIDDSRIFSAILASGVTSPKAIETGSELVDSWTSSCANVDRRYRTIALEQGFFITLDPLAFVVGAVDKIAVESECHCESEVCRCDKSPFVFEMKTTAAGSRGWTAEKWLGELASLHQVGTYGAALKFGTFIERDENERVIGKKRYGVTNPRVLARAVSKSKPPQIWPDANGAWIDIDEGRINATINAYRNAAAAIRGQRYTGLVPWQLPGKHCIKSYGTKEFRCERWKGCREEGRYPAEEKWAELIKRGISPGSQTVVDYLLKSGRIPLDADPRNVVILSASSYTDYAQCPEKWRQRRLAGDSEESEALDIGTVFHCAVLEYSQQMKKLGF